MAWLPAKRTGKRANLTEKAGFPAGELLGITAEQIRQNTHVLAELNPQETTEQVKKYLEGLAPDEQREWDFEYIHRETGERRWFHVIAMGSDVEGRRKYICHQVYPCGRNGVGAAQAASKLTERQSIEKAKRRSRPRTHLRARDAGRSPAHTARKGGGGCAVCREFEKILGRMQ